MARFDELVALESLARLRPDLTTGFSHAGWNRDRYPDLDTLDAGKSITVADLEGPGVIRRIHSTRHAPASLFARGLILEIYFDDADEPAVRCPVADFFGDGCNGGDMNATHGPRDFSSLFLELAPWSYNCYFPMPFKHRARVIIRNDTDEDAINYSFVEWEPLPKWRDDYGYFHATYYRKTFRLLADTDETFLEIQGKGHIIGRQYSIATDDPAFKGFAYVMEGNNEVDIDGRDRALDYLGTEDSFGFSWGFIRPFIGLRAGMPLVQHEDPALLSIYCFYDHNPIRFNHSLRWHINWSTERHFHGDLEHVTNGYWDLVHKPSRESGGCWVDYATVHYWYQDSPAGFTHRPLRPLEERTKPLLHPNKPASD